MKIAVRRLPTALEAPSQKLVEELALRLEKEVPEISPPEWSQLAKTASFKQRPPSDPKWWYKRAASILRVIYVKGPIGISKLRSRYGGRKDLPMRKAHYARSGSSAIRKILHQLGAAGLIAPEKKGRAITPKGRSMLDSVAKEMLRGGSS